MVQGLPKEHIKAKHSEHDGQVSQDTNSVAQFVNEQEPLVHHPEERVNNDQ